MPMLDSKQLNRIADQLLIDYSAHSPGSVFAGGLRLSVDDAWRVQEAVAQRREQRGERVIGYKIGCVFEGNQKQMGLTHPVWGRLWSTEQFDNGVQLMKSDFANVAIEAEFAITINRAIEPTGASAELVAEAVETIFPVLELHNLALRGDAPHGHELIANNAIHAGVVRGAGVKGAREFPATDLALVFDGNTIDSWTGIQWPQGVLSAIQWLADRLARDGHRLEPGDTILTSALGPPIPVGDVQRVDVTSSVFGNVSATFV